MASTNIEIKGNWGKQVRMALTVPEPIFLLLQTICTRKGVPTELNEVRDMVFKSVQDQMQINLLQYIPDTNTETPAQ